MKWYRLDNHLYKDSGYFIYVYLPENDNWVQIKGTTVKYYWKEIAEQEANELMFAGKL